VNRGKTIVLRGQPNVRDAQRRRQTSEHPFDGLAESSRALGTSSSSEEEAVPVATGFREQITEPPHPRDRQMDGRAKAFPPSLHRRFSLRMAGLATVACRPIRRPRPWTSRRYPPGHLGTGLTLAPISQPTQSESQARPSGSPCGPERLKTRSERACPRKILGF
jgi:hypothetical protein